MSTGDPAAILAELVAFRTDAHEGSERPLADHLAARLRTLGADDVIVADVARADGAKPASYVYAKYGAPRLLVNAHLDTVPPNADWSTNPFTPTVKDGRLHALGSADTKGAIAAILSALESVKPKDTGILFSGDEEFSSVVMKAFVASPHRAGLERAIVCEPTNLRAGTQHRGIASFEVDVSGPGGHSSKADELPAPVAILAHVAVALDAWAKERRDVGPPGFLGTCLNIAKLDGGVAFNVIPAHARLEVSLRPSPGTDTKAMFRELEEIVRREAPSASMVFRRNYEPFATRDVASFEPLLGDVARTPIDLAFWTEAALLSAAGVDAVVLGPGNIQEAHGPNEWVSIEELCRARALFERAFR